MTGMECSRLHDLAPELALGVLDGAERAEALAHLERCAKCHADVASLTELGEQLLLLAPEVPPPAGFETRVLDQVERLRWTALPPDDVAAGSASSAAVRPGKRTAWSARVGRVGRVGFRRALVAAAAVAVLGVGSAVVLVARSDDGAGRDGPIATPDDRAEPEPVVVASAPMINPQRGMTIGTVDLLDTTPTTVRVDLAEWMEDIAGWSDPPEGPWTLEVFDAAGHHETYDLPLPADDPMPDVTLGADLGPVHHVSVLDGTGRTWCTGLFA